MKILITGRDGYLGSSISDFYKNKYHVTSIGRKDLNLLEKSDVTNFLVKNKFDVIIHCAIEGGNRLINDSKNVFDNNMKMFYNLYELKKFYKKFITFGSGAEIHQSNSYYGKSKKEISDILKNKNNFINLRLFGVFDENELNRRFVKSNLINYLNKTPLMVHKNKYMDFIYMKDLLKIIDFFLLEKTHINEMDCVYKEKIKLTDICEKINNLSDYKVPVNLIDSDLDNNYTGVFTELNIDFFGLDYGIKNTFEIIKNKINENIIN